MSTLEDLNKIVRDSIKTSVGIEAIVSNQNGSRISEPFATVFTAEIIPAGMADIEIKNKDVALEEKVVRMFQARMSINFFREGARINAALFASSLNSSKVTEEFNKLNIGIFRFSSIRDLTQAFNSSQEERSQFDLFLHFELTAPVFDLQAIEFVSILGVTENNKKEIEEVFITNRFFIESGGTCNLEIPFVIWSGATCNLVNSLTIESGATCILN